MAIIIPAILEQTKEKFSATSSLVTKIPGVERIQVDFADGKFVPNTLLPVAEIDALNPAFIWEAHIMCEEPKDFLDYKICGFKKVVLHYEAYSNKNLLTQALKQIQDLGLEPAVCLNLDTPVSYLTDYVFLKNFQLMGIKPGFQGSPFFPETLERIKELKALLPHAIIEIDGGVNETNIKSIKEAGADLIVVGSAIVKTENPKEAFEKLNAN
ncbi:MAG: hypothetical protein JNN11_03955 [Candidatus Doudnabacteria bacterium]|nr:hypothetical protein [Candidatus Doudnabacteria bacterium]